MSVNTNLTATEPCRKLTFSKSVSKREQRSVNNSGRDELE